MKDSVDLTIIYFIHFIAFFIILYLLTPKGPSIYLSQQENEENKKYSVLFDKNFPFTSKFLLFSYFFCFFLLLLNGKSRSGYRYLTFPFIFNSNSNPNLFIYTISLIALIMISLYILIIIKEYNKIDEDLKNQKPDLGNLLYGYIYSISVVIGLSIINIINKFL